MSDIDTAALREAALAATPGPWRDVWGVGINFGDVHATLAKGGVAFIANAEMMNDAKFIAAASPNVVLALLDRLATVEATIQRTPQILDEHGEDSGGLGCICGWWRPDDEKDATYDAHLAAALLTPTDTATITQAGAEGRGKGLCDHPGLDHTQRWSYCRPCPRCKVCKFIGHGPLCTDCATEEQP